MAIVRIRKVSSGAGPGEGPGEEIVDDTLNETPGPTPEEGVNRGLPVVPDFVAGQAVDPLVATEIINETATGGNEDDQGIPFVPDRIEGQTFDPLVAGKEVGESIASASSATVDAAEATGKAVGEAGKAAEWFYENRKKIVFGTLAIVGLFLIRPIFETTAGLSE